MTVVNTFLFSYARLLYLTCFIISWFFRVGYTRNLLLSLLPQDETVALGVRKLDDLELGIQVTISC